MKTKIFFACFIIALIPLIYLSSCSKFQDLAAFDVRYTIPRTTFTYTPAPFKSGEQLLYSGSVTANLDSIMNSHGVSSGIIGATTFTRCSITMVQPTDQTFSWLHSARGEISQNADFTPVQEVGYVVNTDTTATTVILTLNNVNIRPYLGARQFYFRVFGVLNGPLPVDWVEMYIDGQLLMHVEPL
jgi:hypothetical protein